MLLNNKRQITATFWREYLNYEKNNLIFSYSPSIIEPLGCSHSTTVNYKYFRSSWSRPLEFDEWTRKKLRIDFKLNIQMNQTQVLNNGFAKQ
ncbi:hypothetical protein Elgi_56540 [Paenibacillus elgii]|nr:hypothetical protein Elgi_56540 [Paenibacillus elgii]